VDRLTEFPSNHCPAYLIPPWPQRSLIFRLKQWLLQCSMHRREPNPNSRTALVRPSESGGAGNGVRASDEYISCDVSIALKTKSSRSVCNRRIFRPRRGIVAFVLGECTGPGSGCSGRTCMEPNRCSAKISPEDSGVRGVIDPAASAHASDAAHPSRQSARGPEQVTGSGNPSPCRGKVIGSFGSKSCRPEP
jgi:hypothetical protein